MHEAGVGVNMMNIYLCWWMQINKVRRNIEGLIDTDSSRKPPLYSHRSPNSTRNQDMYTFIKEKNPLIYLAERLNPYTQDMDSHHSQTAITNFQASS